LACLLLIIVTVVSCSKGNVDIDPFSLNITIINKLPSTEDGYNYGWVDDDVSTYDVEVSADAYTESGIAALDNNLNIGDLGFLDRFAMVEDETVSLNHTIDLDVGAVVQVNIQSWNGNESFWVNNGDNVTVSIPDPADSFETYIIQGATGTNPVVSDVAIVGKWVDLNGCINANGEQTYFQFNENGSGEIFYVDCYSVCEGFGYYLYFNWTDNGDAVSLDYTSRGSYCGETAETPSPESLSYSLSGDTLTMAGATWTRD